MCIRDSYTTGALRSRNRDALAEEINAVLVTQPSAHWIALFNEAGVPSGPINSIDQVFVDPQVQHLSIAQTVHSAALGRDITLVGQPVSLSAMPSRVTVAPPEQGEHTEEILREAGFTPEEIAGFRERGTI